MTTNESINDNKKVYNLKYVNEATGGKKSLIKEILDAFLSVVPEEMDLINIAVSETDYDTIKRIAHRMRSSVSIMGITELEPILKEMESLGNEAKCIDEIKQLNIRLNSICKKAFEEIRIEKENYN